MAEPSPPEATAPETEIGDAAGDSANKKHKESSGDSAKQWWRQPKPSVKRAARPIRRVEDEGSDDEEEEDGLPTIEEMARYPEIAFAKAHKRFKTSWESLFPWLILTCDDVGFPILRCSTCLEHGAEGAKTAYGKGGSGGRDMQKGSIRTHQRSTAHQDAHAEMKSKESRKLRQTLLSQFEGLDRSTLHIITALKTTVYICKSEAPITSYVGTIKFMDELGVPNLPLDSKGNYFSEYGSGELLHAAAKYMRQEQLKQIEASPYISIQLDESTDKAHSKHMIVYVHFMKEGASVCEFLTLLTVDKCDTASLVDVLLTHLDAVGIDFVQDCIVHSTLSREVLAAKDAAEKVTEFNIIDQAGIHDVRWISRGEAVKRFAKVLPATIVLLHDFKHALYETVTSFKFHFMLFFLADILAVLNELNAKFQKQLLTCGVLWFNYSSHAHSKVDITVVAGEVSLACHTIDVRYVDCEDRFGNDQSPLLCAFLKKHGNPEHHEVTVKGVDQNGEAAEHEFVLHERKIPGHKTGGDYYSCKVVCQEFARVCVARLEFRLEDLKNLAGSKLFRPSCYPDDNAQRMKKCRKWLGMLDHMFHHCLFGVCFKACERELPLFLHTMDTNHGNMSFHKSLSLMLQSTDYMGAYPTLVQLWQAVAVLPLSTVECERGFTRQNRIKTWKRTCLGDTKLGDLMTAALLPSDGLNWVNVVAVFNARKKRRPAQEFRY
ncbi:unnamed protein product [Closterium sp. NIES-54]